MYLYFTVQINSCVAYLATITAATFVVTILITVCGCVLSSDFFTLATFLVTYNAFTASTSVVNYLPTVYGCITLTDSSLLLL